MYDRLIWPRCQAGVAPHSRRGEYLPLWTCWSIHMLFSREHAADHGSGVLLTWSIGKNLCNQQRCEDEESHVEHSRAGERKKESCHQARFTMGETKVSV